MVTTQTRQATGLTADQQLENLILNYPTEHIWGVVRRVSPVGLEWLQERTGNNPVTFVLSNERAGMNNGKEQSLRASRQFLNRVDVKALKIPARPRGKSLTRGWFVLSDMGDTFSDGLLGDIALTRKELVEGESFFTPVARDELDHYFNLVSAAIAQSKDIAPFLSQRLDYIENKRVTRKSRGTAVGSSTPSNHSKPIEATSITILEQQLVVVREERDSALSALQQEREKLHKLQGKIEMLPDRTQRRLLTP